MVEDALARGWHVTAFRRGQSGHDADGIESVRGDRTDPDDLARLAKHGPWHPVVDTSGYVPREVLAAARANAGEIEVTYERAAEQGIDAEKEAAILAVWGRTECRPLRRRSSRYAPGEPIGQRRIARKLASAVRDGPSVIWPLRIRAGRSRVGTHSTLLASACSGTP